MLGACWVHQQGRRDVTKLSNTMVKALQRMATNGYVQGGGSGSNGTKTLVALAERGLAEEDKSSQYPDHFILTEKGREALAA